MKPSHRVLTILLSAILAGCGEEAPPAPRTVPVPPLAASSPAIASQVLQEQPRDDIIAIGKTVKDNITASEVAAAEAAANTALLAGSDVPASASEAGLPLPKSCELYFQRAYRCYAAQGEFAAELQQMTLEARAEIAGSKPDEAACVALNRSFDAVALNLGCR